MKTSLAASILAFGLSAQAHAQWVVDTSNAYPSVAVGAILYTNDQGADTKCTGTLVGRDLVLTAANCIMKSPGVYWRNSHFQPNRTGGTRLHTDLYSQIYWTAVGNRFNNGEPDWAIGRLRSPLGDRFGYLGTMLPRLGENHTLIGYAGNAVYVDPAGGDIRFRNICQLTSLVPNLPFIESNCPVTGTTAGTPMLNDDPNNWLVMGIVGGSSATYPSNVAFIDAKTYGPHITNFRANNQGKPQEIPYHFCNRSNSDIHVATGMWAGGRLQIAGRQLVSRNTCNEYSSALTNSGEIQIFAWGGGLEWGGNRAAGEYLGCVDTENDFSFPDGNINNCTGPSMRLVTMKKFQLTRDRLNVYNFQ